MANQSEGQLRARPCPLKMSIRNRGTPASREHNYLNAHDLHNFLRTIRFPTIYGVLCLFIFFPQVENKTMSEGGARYLN